MKTVIKKHTIVQALVGLSMAATLVACGSDSDNSVITAHVDKPTATEPSAAAVPKFTIGLLPDTQGGSDATGQSHVALHTM